MINRSFVYILSSFLFFSFFNLLAQAQRAEVIIQGSVFEKKQNNIENPVSAIKVIYSKKVFAFTDKDCKCSI